MNFRQYLSVLMKVAEVHPESLVYSRDDEGNDFQKLHYSPIAGHFEDNEFVSELETNEKLNSVCVN